MSNDSPVAIVTGAGSGIGRAVAVALSNRGYRLALVGRRHDRLAQTGTLLKSRWEAFPTDMSDPEAAHAMVAAVVSRLGRLDVLVNNAGSTPMTPIEKHSVQMIRDIFNLNAVGPTAAAAAAIPHFQKQRSGCIVNVSSKATADPYPGLGVYAAAKAGLNLLAKAIVNEGRPFNIRAFAVAPGAVETELLRSILPEASLPRENTLTPEAVAAVIVSCVVGERESDNGGTIYLPSP